MTSESNPSALELFKAALDRAPDQRAAFLDQACADDEDLRAEVESLLDADAQADRFLESPLRAAAMPDTPERPTDPLIGKRVGRYRIASVIASGGMGTVYEAMQEQPKRRVALKIVRAGLASRTALRRFVHEAEILARLRHPGIAQVFEAGTHGGTGGLPYFAMEYIPGAKRITQHAEDQRLSTRRRLELFAQVCDAVHHGHQRGIIHRDLKPGNILVDEAGQPKVIDFGVARATDADMTIATLQTDVGELVGTLRYMSPEQCEGDAVELDTRCDVYALGVVLFELLTGQLPYDLSSSSPFEAPRVIREEEPRRLSAINRMLRGDIETIVLKALEKDRQRRYQSALSLAQDIRRYLNNEPIEAKRNRAWYMLKKTISRHRVAVGVIALVVLLTTASAIGLGLMYRAADTQRTLAEQAQSEAEENAEALRVGAYFNNITLAQHAYETGNGANLIDLLDKCPVDLRGWEWHYLKRLSDTSLMTLRGHTAAVAAAVSPDGSTIASASWGRTIKLWNAATGREQQTLTSEYSAEHLTFSPDGRWLAWGNRNDETVAVRDLAAGEIRLTLEGHRGVLAVEFSPDGRMIASSHADGTIRLWDASTGERMRELRGHSASSTHIAWSPDGQRLVSANDDATLKVWDADTGLEVLTLTGHTHEVRRVAYSPDGRHIASTSWDNTLRIWDPDSGELLKTFDRDTDHVNLLAFSPDGRRVAASTGDVLRVWDAASGRQESVRLGHVGSIGSLAFTPDGDKIVTGSQDTTIKIWDAAPYEEPPTLRGHEHQVRGVSVSPDGRVIASASRDDTVRLWDARSGVELMVLKGHTTDVEAVTFSPDGRRVASGGYDRTIRIWDATTGEPLGVFQGHATGVRRVAWSPNGARLASAGWDGTVKLWEAKTGELLLSIDAHANGALSVVFSADGTRMITTGHEDSVRIWNVETGEQIRELDGHAEQVDGAAFSPDDKLIAAACGDRCVRIWHARTGELASTLKGHLGLVQCIAFSPDGRRLVSTGFLHFVFVWDVETGAPALTLRAHELGIPGLAFSPDGRWFVTAGNDKTLRIWNAGPSD